MCTVMRGVADVVDEIGSTRRCAVRNERCDRGEPAPGVADLRREDDAREEQQVLRPLPGTKRDERGGCGTATAGKLADRRRLERGHAGIVGVYDVPCADSRNSN